MTGAQPQALAAGVSESAQSLARGGDKSTLTAALACAALDGPPAKRDAEVLIVASSHERGQIVFWACPVLPRRADRARLFVIGTRPADGAHSFAVALREADYLLFVVIV